VSTNCKIPTSQGRLFQAVCGGCKMGSHVFPSSHTQPTMMCSPHPLHVHFFCLPAPLACWILTTLTCDNFSFPSKIIFSLILRPHRYKMLSHQQGFVLSSWCCPMIFSTNWNFCVSLESSEVKVKFTFLTALSCKIQVSENWSQVMYTSLDSTVTLVDSLCREGSAVQVGYC
jgi:hypothetical protein